MNLKNISRSHSKKLRDSKSISLTKEEKSKLIHMMADAGSGPEQGIARAEIQGHFFVCQVEKEDFPSCIIVADPTV